MRHYNLHLGGDISNWLWLCQIQTLDKSGEEGLGHRNSSPTPQHYVASNNLEQTWSMLAP